MTVRIVGVNDGGHVVGQDHHRAKLTDHDVNLIVELHEQGLSYRQIAEKFECDRCLIRDYIKGRRRGQSVVGQKTFPATPKPRRPKMNQTKPIGCAT